VAVELDPDHFVARFDIESVPVVFDLMTRFGGVRYLIAKVVVAVAAYLVWNYPMNHFFVFPARRRA